MEDPKSHKITHLQLQRLVHALCEKRVAAGEGRHRQDAHLQLSVVAVKQVLWLLRNHG